MTSEQIILFVILGAALGLFAWGRLRYDVVAVLALLAAVGAGLVPARDAFSGFGHPAVVTVAAVLILSRSLGESGVVELATRLLQPFARHPSLHVFAICAVVAACSAFMNNVGALALILPVALKSAFEANRAPGEVLMPLSFGSLLGGLVTLIGTPPNIIIANLRAAETGAPFAMFDFTPVGLAVAVVGVAFITLAGWRLVPVRARPEDKGESLFEIEHYITEVRLPSGSPYVGRRLVDLESLGQADVAVVSLVRRKDRILAPSGFLRLNEGDILIIEADTAALKRVVEDAKLDTIGTAELDAEALRSERVSLVEAVVAPGSRLEGRTARNLRLHTRHGMNLLGVSRQGQRLAQRLGQVRFMAGDVLLLQGEREALPEGLAALGCLPLAEREISLARRPTSVLAPVIFGIAMLLAAAGLVAPHVAFVGAAAVLVALGQIGLRQLYESVDWSIVVLLGALIPVGLALETTGGSTVIASPILALEASWPVWAILALLMIVTMLLTDVMNNAATAVLMAPIGITVAHGLGASVDPFLMAVAVGASSAYLTPIGHQSNLLVMGPGGYQFGDYWRMGLPLDVLIVAVAVPMILLVWPL
jgi:di/tricarboxylate transporter